MLKPLFLDPQIFFAINHPTVKTGATYVAGVKVAALSIPIKNSGQDDFCLVYCSAGTQIHAMTTQNKMPAAPVIKLRQNIQQYSNDDAIVLCINAGNANAATGASGLQAVAQISAVIGHELGIPTNNIMPYSTGIIGVEMPLEAILQKLPTLTNVIANQAEPSLDDWLQMSRAIKTTDTEDKLFHLQFNIGMKQYKAVGFAKGAAMIHPNMATMLSYIVTDFPLNRSQIEHCNRTCTQQSFNCISIDSDTSTNDCMSLISTKVNDNKVSEEDYREFTQIIHKLYQQLAFSIIADAEGGTKVLRATVTHEKGKELAASCAKALVSSVLIKTALTAADPNWGRLVMALGNALDEDVDISQISIKIGDCIVLDRGQMSQNYDEQIVAQQMSQPLVDIGVIIQSGDNLDDPINYTAAALGCDLTTEYVILNSEYRT